MRLSNKKLDVSNFDSIDICMMLKNDCDQRDFIKLTGRAIYILNNPEVTDKPFDEQGLSNLIFNIATKQTFAKDWHRKNEFVEAWYKNFYIYKDDFIVQGLNNSLYAFSKLEIDISHKFLKEWEKVVINKIHQFETYELYNLLENYNLLRIKPSDSLISAFEEAAIDNIFNFSNDQLIGIIYKLNYLRIVPSKAFIEAWEKAAICKINLAVNHQLNNLDNALNSEQLSKLFYVFKVLMTVPSKDFISTWENAAINEIYDFDTISLSKIIFTYSQIATMPSSNFLSLWVNATDKKILQFNSQQLSNSIYAFISLGLKVPPTLIKRCNELNVNEFKPEELHQLWYAHKSGYEINDALLNAINEKFNEHTIPKKEPSHLHGRVSHALTMLNHNHEIEQYINVTKTRVDIYIFRRNLIIQVDGLYYHSIKTINGELQLNPSSKLNTKLLKDAGFNVERISNKDIEYKEDFKDVLKYIDNLVNKYPLIKRYSASVTNDNSHFSEEKSEEVWVTVGKNNKVEKVCRKKIASETQLCKESKPIIEESSHPTQTNTKVSPKKKHHNKKNGLTVDEALISPANSPQQPNDYWQRKVISKEFSIKASCNIM